MLSVKSELDFKLKLKFIVLIKYIVLNQKNVQNFLVWGLYDFLWLAKIFNNYNISIKNSNS